MVLLFEVFDALAKISILYQEFLEHFFNFVDMPVVFMYAVIYVAYEVGEIRGGVCGTASGHISQFQRLR